MTKLPIKIRTLHSSDDLPKQTWHWVNLGPYGDHGCQIELATSSRTKAIALATAIRIAIETYGKK